VRAAGDRVAIDLAAQPGQVVARFQQLVAGRTQQQVLVRRVGSAAAAALEAGEVHA
jgi:hypothetical protein